MTRQARAARGLHGMSPEAIFVLGGISQNVGTTLAKSLFDDLEPGTVAWIRISFAAIVLLALTWRRWAPWSRTALPFSRRELGASAALGVTIALMNLFFYLAIDRLDVGKGMTIEFIGPIAVAASRTRTVRNAIAVVLAVIGVCMLSGLELDGNGLGLVFIFLASAMWAAYIVIGSHVARQQRGLAGLSTGLALGALVLVPFGAPSSGAAFGSPRLLLACCAVGLFTSVIGYSLDQHIMRRIQPARFALLLALLPVTAMFFAFVALDERPAPLDYVGVAFVLAGVITQQRDEEPALLEELPAA